MEQNANVQQGIPQGVEAHTQAPGGMMNPPSSSQASTAGPVAGQSGSDCYDSAADCGPTACSTGQEGNPGSTGPTGVATGPIGAPVAGVPGTGPQVSTGMTGAGAPGTANPQMGPPPGQASAQFPGMGQMEFQPSGYPGAGAQGPSAMMGGGMNPQMDFSTGPSMQGPGPGMQQDASSQDAYQSSVGGSGTGYMGESAHHIHHDENRYGQFADMVSRFLNGQATSGDMVNGLFSLNFRDDQFWKGAIVGVLAAVVLNSDMVKQGLAKTFGAKPEEETDKKAPSEGKKKNK